MTRGGAGQHSVHQVPQRSTPNRSNPPKCCERHQDAVGGTEKLRESHREAEPRRAALPSLEVALRSTTVHSQASRVAQGLAKPRRLARLKRLESIESHRQVPPVARHRAG